MATKLASDISWVITSIVGFQLVCVCVCVWGGGEGKREEDKF